MSCRFFGLAIIGVVISTKSMKSCEAVVDRRCATPPPQRYALADSSLLQQRSKVEHVTTEVRDFTVVFIPDTQFMVMNNGYSGAWLHEWIAQAEWIVKQQHALNIAAIIHVGDVVEEAHRSWEWDNFFKGWDKIEATGIPWSVVPGNHDLTSMAQPFASNRWDDYNRFMEPVFRRNPHLQGNFPSEKYENSVVFFEASGIEFMIVGIELGPTQESLDWASKQLNQYPGKHAIVNNHFVLWGAERGIDIVGWAKRHRNIFMIQQGHDCVREWNRVIFNDWGEPIQEVLTDYQCSGDAFLRYYTFRVSEHRVDAFTYSPSLGIFETDANSQWGFDFKMMDPPSPSSPSAVVSPEVANHYRKVSGVGGWGGWCVCPDGRRYNVGDRQDACANGPQSLACEGGTPEECEQRHDSTRYGMKVTCVGDEPTTTLQPDQPTLQPSPLAVSSTENFYREVPNVGGWGGMCTCPDGQSYNVGDNYDACANGPQSLACEGGEPGECVQQHDSTRHGMKVTCAAGNLPPAPTRSGSLPVCSADSSRLNAWDCASADLGSEQLTDPTFSSEASWTSYRFRSADASFVYKMPGVVVTANEDGDNTAWHVQLMQDVELNRDGGARYELCVQAGAAAARAVLQLSVDGGAALNYAIAGGTEAVQMELPPGSLHTNCFRFTLSDSPQQYIGRVALEFGAGVGDAVVCNASLRRCRS